LGVVLALPPSLTSSDEGPVWFWFSECGGPSMTLEVRLNRDTVYQSSIPLCHAQRESVHSRGLEHAIHFTFRPRRSIRWTGYRDEAEKTAAGRPLEVDLWEAGADPDALLIGAAVSDGDTLRMNTITPRSGRKRRS
jgi:hypothetical protein